MQCHQQEPGQGSHIVEDDSELPNELADDHSETSLTDDTLPELTDDGLEAELADDPPELSDDGLAELADETLEMLPELTDAEEADDDSTGGNQHSRSITRQTITSPGNCMAVPIAPGLPSSLSSRPVPRRSPM